MGIPALELSRWRRVAMKAYSLGVTGADGVSYTVLDQQLLYVPTYETAVQVSIVASWRRTRGDGSSCTPCPSPTPSSASAASAAHSRTSRLAPQFTPWSVLPFSAHSALKPDPLLQATVCQSLSSYSSYRDSRSPLPIATQHANLAQSATVYVGNLSFFTTEEQVRLASSSHPPPPSTDGLYTQIYELFSRVGEIKRVIMGLDRNARTPCGFCFVEYFHHDHALSSLRYISGTKLDERIIRADLDPGYLENRQYGRGKSGGQVRDEHRDDFDAGRGGWGHLKTREEMEEGRQREQDEIYRGDHDTGRGREVPTGAGDEEDEVSPVLGIVRVQ